MKAHRNHGFTILELLVVISIIALLLGILLPAIGRARDDARISISKSNLRQLAVAHKTYAADWADRHVTYTRDNLGLSGGDVVQYNQDNYGTADLLRMHPPISAGWGYSDANEYRLWAYWPRPGHEAMFLALGFGEGPGAEAWGWFRFGVQPKAFNKYVNGRYHDPIFYAPKDRIIREDVEPCFEIPGEFVGGEDFGGIGPNTCNPGWSSYCLSPAGLFSPAVFSANSQGGHWNQPWTMPAGYRVPSFGHVKFPSLKTHMLEHQWLQGTAVACNSGMIGLCEPYYFNHAYHSEPVTLFYDGSVRLVSVVEAMSSDARHEHQAGYGLWSRDTPFGDNGYLIDVGYDYAADTSFHILTTDGVRGRDTLGGD